MNTTTVDDHGPAITDDGLSLAFKAARLWEREGASGPYLSGTMGNVRVIVTRNAHPQDEDDSPWILVFAPNDPARSPRKPRKERAS